MHSNSRWTAALAARVHEVTGHNLEARGRKEVNRLLETVWRLLHIYTLRYEENGVWRERPMAILGRLKQHSQASLAAPVKSFVLNLPTERNAKDLKLSPSL